MLCEPYFSTVSFSCVLLFYISESFLPFSYTAVPSSCSSSFICAKEKIYSIRQYDTLGKCADVVEYSSSNKHTSNVGTMIVILIVCDFLTPYKLSGMRPTPWKVKRVSYFFQNWLDHSRLPHVHRGSLSSQPQSHHVLPQWSYKEIRKLSFSF